MGPDASWNLIDQKFFSVQKRCSILKAIIFDHDPETDNKFLEKFRASMAIYNLNSGDKIELQTSHFSYLKNRGLLDELEKARKDLVESSTQSTPLSKVVALIILPYRDVKSYPIIKRWADCTVGVPTVCVVRQRSIKKAAEDEAVYGNIRFVLIHTKS